jgi:hypothetical protein
VTLVVELALHQRAWNPVQNAMEKADQVDGFSAVTVLGVED